MNPLLPLKRLLGLIVTLSLAIAPAGTMAAGKPKTSSRAKSPSSAAPKNPKMDPRDQPFTPDDRGLLREPFPPAGWKTDATFSGSIHSPREFGNFFQRPEFKKKEHDGRLYFTNYLCREPHNTVAFVTWRPLNAKADVAQHMRPIPGYSVEDFQTDGKVLEIQQYPSGPKKSRIKVQIYRWEGDQAGNGRFVLQKTRDGEWWTW
jgi:hypothetical protein